MVLCTGPANSKVSNMGEDSPDVINLLSDLEEGELEEISDVSSDEELLLMQRIEILEKYNSVLEKKFIREQSQCRDPVRLPRRRDRRALHSKIKHLKRRRKSLTIRENLSKRHRHKKTDYSTDSDVDLSRKKKILREAVVIHDKKINQTSLKNRLFPLIKEPAGVVNIVNDDVNASKTEKDDGKENISELNKLETDTTNVGCVLENSSNTSKINKANDGNHKSNVLETKTESRSPESLTKSLEIDNCSSEDDAEILRQLALNSKSKRRIIPPTEINEANIQIEENILKEDENKEADDGSDIDIAELRINALRSAMLKKALERKRHRKESRKKRNSKRFRTTVVFSDLENATTNNDSTDGEQIDMDVDPESIQSNTNNIFYSQDLDGAQNMDYIDQQCYLNYPSDPIMYQFMYNDLQYYDSNNYMLQPIKHSDTHDLNSHSDNNKAVKEDVDEEEEDVLRAQLLNAINSKSLKSLPAAETTPSTSRVSTISKTDESNLIIRLGESDSESDCAETKQLIKTNQEILRETAFQRQLDLFLKTARSKVESISSIVTPKKLAAIQSPVVKKHTPVAVKHLPAADQQEYRQLVKRMTELQSIKMAKQQQAMINNIAIKSKDDDQNVSKQVDKEGFAKNSVNTKGASANSSNGWQAKPCPDDKSLLAEKQRKISKAIELHLENNRKKMVNCVKTMKRLDGETKNLNMKYNNLKIQQQEIEFALKNTKEKLTDNQRLAIQTKKMLAKLRKNEDILRNKIKTVAPGLQGSDPNIYSTKITLKNKVINKKHTLPQILPVNHVSNVPIRKTIQNNIAAKKIIVAGKNGITNQSNNTIKNNSKNDVPNISAVLNKDTDKKLNSLEKISKVQYNETKSEVKTKRLVSKSGIVTVIDQNVETMKNTCDDSTKNTVDKDIADQVGNMAQIESKHVADVANVKPKICNSNEVANSRNVKQQPTTDSIESTCHKEALSDNAHENSSSLEPPSLASKLEDSSTSDYRSPLNILRTENNWTEGAEAIFCPFEVGGSCKDLECKYFHPKL